MRPDVGASVAADLADKQRLEIGQAHIIRPGIGAHPPLDDGDLAPADEVNDVRDKVVAMQHYVRQAKNKDLEADALEIRLRATGRLDQLLQLQKETAGLAQDHCA